MSNSNGFWKKVGVIFGIIVVFATVGAGYVEVKIKTERNVTDISEVKRDIREIKKDQTTLKVNSAKILELVKFLKERADGH